MLRKSALALIRKHEDSPGKLHGDGGCQYRTAVNGRQLDVIFWGIRPLHDVYRNGRHPELVARVMVLEANGNSLHWGGPNSLRDALRKALRRSRTACIVLGEKTVTLTVEVGRLGLNLEPHLSFCFTHGYPVCPLIVSSTLQDPDAFGMANSFIQGSDPLTPCSYSTGWPNAMRTSPANWNFWPSDTSTFFWRPCTWPSRLSSSAAATMRTP